MSFPFDATAALVQKFRSLNEPVTGLPAIAPVALVADYTRRTSGEVTECRGISGWRHLPLAGANHYFQIQAPVRPVVVESIRLLVTSGGTHSMHLTVGAVPFIGFLPPYGNEGVMDLGGVGHTAAVDQGPFAAAFGGLVQVPIQTNVMHTVPENGDLRALIPPGWFLSGGITVAGGGVACEVLVLFREVIT